jgi:Zn2+/Cd2+-exporting ATPase
MEHQFELRVEGVDCVEEVSILKQTFASYGVDKNQVMFDLLNGKLTIRLNQASQTLHHEADVIRVIKTTGMKAIPWDVYLKTSQKPQGFVQRHHRLMLTSMSGVCLLLGYFLHASTHGFLDAFSGHEGVSLPVPVPVMVLYALAMLSGGWFVFPKAWSSVKHLRADMNVLMTVAVTGAIILGQWFEAAAVTFLFSLALLLEAWSVGRARTAIQSLLASVPKTAWVLEVSSSSNATEMPVDVIDVGAVVMIRPGDKIPLDGEVVKGRSHVNQAPITGESMPIEKRIGDEVYAGTLNEEGSLEVRVSKKSTDTTFAHIIKRIEEAQSNRSKSEQWVEVFARYYTPLMILFALSIAAVPPLLFNQPWATWFYEGLVILVIACPCALVISTPVSIIAGLSRAARHGVLIKGGVYLEIPAKLQAIALDKTGTLTYGQPKVELIVPLNKHTATDLLGIAASLEFKSEHPLARAICRRAEEDALVIKPVEHFTSIQGKGVEGSVDGKTYWLGSHRFLHEKLNQEAAANAHDEAMVLEELGQSVVILGRDNHVCGLIGVADSIRPCARETLQAIKDVGVKHIEMLTGDNEGTARVIANQVELDAFQADLLPEDKLKQVKLLQDKYITVAMVGDGVNDAPAMASVSLGIAMGAMGSDVAIETADIALMSDDLTKIPWLIQHSRRTLNIIKENIAFALATKAVFLVLALLGIATLWMAIAADMGASLIVIFNGLRLLKA